jgi:hypothetical protein
VASIDTVIVAPDDTETAFEAALCDYLEQLLALARGLLEEAELCLRLAISCRQTGARAQLIVARQYEAQAADIIEHLERARG